MCLLLIGLSSKGARVPTRQTTAPRILFLSVVGGKRLRVVRLQLCQRWELVPAFGPPADPKRLLILLLLLR